jgi:twitching motility protein PilT
LIAQQLVPGVDGVMRWPATEITISTDAVRALVRKGEDHQLRSQTSVGHDGWLSIATRRIWLIRVW